MAKDKKALIAVPTAWDIYSLDAEALAVLGTSGQPPNIVLEVLALQGMAKRIARFAPANIEIDGTLEVEAPEGEDEEEESEEPVKGPWYDESEN